MKKVNWESVLNQLDDDLLQNALSCYGYGGALPSPKEKEILKMKKNHHYIRRLGTIAAAVALIFALAITAYAADIGGIQRTIQLWLYGNQTNVILDIQDGQYTLTNDAGDVIISGGGVSIDPDGSERPLTEDEIIDHLDKPDLLYREDGTVWIFYRGQKIEITNLFDADGICYLELRDGEDILYVTATKENGIAFSPDDYVQPWQFGMNK